MSNPRHEAQHLTWTGFKETGIWVIARIMFVPTIVWCLFYFGQQAMAETAGEATQGGASFGAIADKLNGLDLDISDVFTTGSGNGSDGSLLGFGVGSAPASTGAKWGRP